MNYKGIFVLILGLFFSIFVGISVGDYLRGEPIDFFMTFVNAFLVSTGVGLIAFIMRRKEHYKTIDLDEKEHPRDKKKKKRWK